MIRVSDIKAPLHLTLDELRRLVEKTTGIGNIRAFKISKRSIDARNKKNIHFLYSFTFEIDGDEEKAVRSSSYQKLSIEKNEKYFISMWRGEKALRPVVVGSGPAGMMAALALAEAGACPIVIERGRPVPERQKDVERFWAGGSLDVNSNVQFGEGGAGTFSDGKLTTGIKKDASIGKVLKEFVEAGAPEEIAYVAKPHIGTDRLAFIVQKIRKKIISMGGEYRFETQLIDLISKKGALESIIVKSPSGELMEMNAKHIILAIGHSARDTFEMLYKKNVIMLQKAFSVGARIEHPQSLINASQYGTEKTNPLLGAADYKLAVHLPEGRSAYTFCMCPGGVVVAASSEEGRLVTNGMSEYARDKVNANSALLVNVKPEDFGSAHPLQGMYFQRHLEEAAFQAGGGNYRAPAQCVGDFIADRESSCFGAVIPSYLPGVVPADLRAFLPPFVTGTMKKAIIEMDKKLKGFASADAVLTGPETRSSSPIRIVRDEQTLQSVSMTGLYPCGEGAGYAGGIMSAAVDGLKCASKLVEQNSRY